MATDSGAAGGLTLATRIAEETARHPDAPVVLPDGPLVHAVYVGAEKAGVVVMGIGPKAGEHEATT